MALPHENGPVRSCNGEILVGIRKIITVYPEAKWTTAISETLAGLHLLLKILEVSQYTLAFKWVPTWEAAHSPTSEVGTMGYLLGEDSPSKYRYIILARKIQTIQTVTGACVPIIIHLGLKLDYTLNEFCP